MRYSEEGVWVQFTVLILNDTKVDYGTSLFSGFYSRGPPATLLAHVLDVLVGSIPCMNYDSWVVYAPKGEFSSSVDPTVFSAWRGI
ncbi:hypothetical protein RND71_009225 [Anisodus tanguticus]|uniref:Uncharacterized protein n=1 Tax=Anisodus tanguticus TaxID=243964 RepID=A0AAE1SGU1_9SOLA|nr:hypothetical protein RND71_009225 [Anisodus tanguticus]